MAFSFQAVLYNDVIKQLDKSKYNVYAVEKIAAHWGVTLIRQPPYHCQYNAIEVVWAWFKGVSILSFQ